MIELLKMTRVNLQVFQAAHKRLIEALVVHPDLKERAQRLHSIQGVGEAMALTWALEMSKFRFAKSSLLNSLTFCPCRSKAILLKIG